MQATISLKQLRTDPREYVRLLNSGYEVVITEHRKTLVSAARPQKSFRQKKGNAQAVLDAIASLPPIKTPYPDMDTLDLIKKTRVEGYEQRYRKISDDRS